MANTRCYESEAITSAYVKHRNIYPKQQEDVIIEYAFENKSGKKEKLGRMVEVGCGSGQITKLLAPYFREVIASDVSINQIKYAKESNTFEHVSYVVGAAEDIQVADKSADMVVSATSVHWFNLPNFFREVARVLKPGGCLAIIWYDLPQCSPSGGNTELLSDNYDEVMNNVMSLTSHKSYLYAKTLLAGLFQNISSESKTRKYISRTINYSLTNFKGYLQSEDGFQNRNQNTISEKTFIPDLTVKELDLVEEFGSQLKRAWKMEERSEKKLKFTLLLNSP